MKQKLKGADEFDCIYARKYLNGNWKAIKRKMNKRFRKEGKKDANSKKRLYE